MQKSFRQVGDEDYVMSIVKTTDKFVDGCASDVDVQPPICCFDLAEAK